MSKGAANKRCGEKSEVDSDSKRRRSEDNESREDGLVTPADNNAAAPRLTADERTLLALRSALTTDPDVPYTKKSAAAVVFLPGSLARLPACKVESTLAIVRLCAIAPKLAHSGDEREVQVRDKLKALGVWDLLLEMCAALIAHADLGCLGNNFTSECAPFEAYMPTEGERYSVRKNALVEEVTLTRKVAFLCHQFYLGGDLARSAETASAIAHALRLCLVSETSLWRDIIMGLAECSGKIDILSGLHNILASMMTGHPKCTPRLASCMNAVAELAEDAQSKLRKKFAGSLLKEFNMAVGSQPSCYYDETDDAVVLYPCHPGYALYYAPECIYYVYNLRTRCLGPMPCHIESPKECVVNSFKSMAAYMAKTEARNCNPGEGWWRWFRVTCCGISEKQVLPKYVKGYGAPRDDDDVERYHEVPKLQYELPTDYGFKVRALSEVDVTSVPDDEDDYEKMTSAIVQTFEANVQRNPSSDPRLSCTVPMKMVKTVTELRLEAQVIGAD